MTLNLPKNIQDYQDRNLMTIEADDYLFILKEFHRLLRRTLHPSIYAVFCAIEDHAGPTEQNGIPAYTCFASHTTLADEVSVKRLTVFRAVKHLEEVGLISVEDREGETSFIHPIATPEQRALFLLKHKETSDTCIKKIQVTYPMFQNDTTTCIKKEQPPVSKRYTNVTTLTEPQESNKTTDTNVSGEMLSQATNLPILNFPLTDSPPDKASQSSFFSEPIPVDLEAKRVSRVKAQKPKPEKKTRASPAWQDLPQFVIWRKYANLKHYKAWPNLQEREAIIKHIPPDEDNLERWEGLIQIWLDREHNFKIFNIDGLVDVFVNGWREKSYSRKGRY